MGKFQYIYIPRDVHRTHDDTVPGLGDAVMAGLSKRVGLAFIYLSLSRIKKIPARVLCDFTHSIEGNRLPVHVGEECSCGIMDRNSRYRL